MKKLAMKIPKNYRLGWFPQLDPAPRIRISPDGQVLYANPASIFLLKALELDPEHPELLLPADFTQRLHAMPGGGTRAWDYRIDHQPIKCLVHYLPEAGYFHAFLTETTGPIEVQVL